MQPFLVPDAAYADVLSSWQRGAAPDPAALARLCALVRLDTLAALVAAQHGWLGASFSCVEILAAAYALHAPDPRRPLAERAAVVLSKGHAAAAHYALLAALGAFPRARLLDYKAAGGPPAHSDRAVPGVDTDSGSLGQGLSKAVGLALARAAAGVPHPTFAVLGDGELQEGQVFEALLTLARLRPPRCVAVVDRNGLQTDSRTADVKDAADWEAVFAGVGLPVRRVPGHDLPALLAVFADAAERTEPLVVIAETVKGEGSALTRMPAATTERRAGHWHGRIPSAAEYAAIAAELVARAAHPALAAAFESHRAAAPAPAPASAPAPADRAPHATKPAGSPAPPAPPALSTGAAFGAALFAAADRHPDLVVLDADLERSCRLDDFAGAHPDRFVEVGISEQDMVSVAAGLALGGRLPVTNTYAAFYKRAADQLAVCAAEGLPVLFVGHYAGLDYTTDGKSHQSLTDLALLRAVAAVPVYEPLTAAEVAPLLDHLLAGWAAARAAGGRLRPAYLRLHRTPVTPEPALPGGPAPARGAYAFPARPDGPPAPTRLVVGGPHLLALALAAQAALRERGGALDVLAVSAWDEARPALTAFAAGAARLVTLEDGAPAGGLADHVATVAGAAPVRLGPGPIGGSTRTYVDALAAHGLGLDLLLEALGGAAGS